jgi:hypothetical protein
MMMFEMIRNIWSWDSASPASAAIMDALVGIIDGK